MTPLQKQLQQASFRGVPFQVTGSDVTGGRRVLIHEFPQRDKPQHEDLGRSVRGFTVAGFVVGADYIKRAGELIAALEQPGSGTLVHPWHGTMQVTLRSDFRVSYDSRGLGMASFELPFMEAGEVAFPTATPATEAQSRIAADDMQAASVAQFDATYKVKGVPDFVAAASVANWQTALDVLKSPLPGTESLGYANQVADLIVAAEQTAANPSIISQRLVSALGLTSLANTVQRWERIIPGLLRIVSSGRLAPDVSSPLTASRKQLQKNVNATNALMRRVVLTQAVGASTLMPVVMHDQAMAIRNALTSALDAESLNAEDDATYRALQAARAAVWADLTRRARNAARIKVWRPVQVMPALVAAQQLYGDATRAGEIAERNGVRRPGFLSPTIDLKVLTT